MDLSIIIVNYNVYSDIITCIQSIYKYLTNIDFEIIVVDNNSSDRSIEELNDQFSDIKLLLLNENNGFGAANNAALKFAKGNYFFLVNPDIIFENSSVVDMFNYIKGNKDIGTIGPIQIKPGKGIEYYYAFFPGLYSRFAQEFGLYMSAPFMKPRFSQFWNMNIAKGKPFKVDWVIGSSLLIRREAYNQVGGFDEAFFLYEEETEWQYRINRSGWVSNIYPKANVIHNHHSSSGKLGQIFIHFHEFRSRIIFSAKHDNLIKRITQKMMTSTALSLRIMINFVKYLFTGNKDLSVKVKVFFKLFLFNLRFKNKILSDRFDFNDLMLTMGKE